jgi:predicted dehydrogenase
VNRDEIEILYVAVPHNVHAKIYGEVLEAGKDLLAEKPFGIDLAGAEQIAAAAQSTKRFLRCSSEFFRFCLNRNGRSKRFVRGNWAGSWR